jgi:hypothetical protein
MPQRFPGILSQGPDLVEPVMYLSWTGDVPVMHPPYSRATGNIRKASSELPRREDDLGYLQI